MIDDPLPISCNMVKGQRQRLPRVKYVLTGALIEQVVMHSCVQCWYNVIYHLAMFVVLCISSIALEKTEREILGRKFLG